MQKTRILLNKYLGLSILVLFKTLMYDFHYCMMIPRNDKRIMLFYIALYSYIYYTLTPCFYVDMTVMSKHLETSEYPGEILKLNDLPCVNIKVLGKMKDENGRNVLVGLRSNMYFLRMKEAVSNGTKGVKMKVVEKEKSFDCYKYCLFDGEEQYKRMNLIRSGKYELYYEELKKLALSPHDIKGEVLDGVIETLEKKQTLNIPRLHIIFIGCMYALTTTTSPSIQRIPL